MQQFGRFWPFCLIIILASCLTGLYTATNGSKRTSMKDVQEFIPSKRLRTNATRAESVPEPQNYLHTLPNDVLHVVYARALEGSSYPITDWTQLRLVSTREAALFSPYVLPLKNLVLAKSLIWKRLGILLLKNPAMRRENTEALHYLANVMTYLKKATIWRNNFNKISSFKRSMMMSNTNNLILDSILGDVTHRDLFCPMTDSLIELLLQSPSKFIIDPQNFGMGDSFFVSKTNYNQNVISEASLKWGTIAQPLKSFFEILFLNIPQDQRPSFHFILGAVSLYGNMTIKPLTVNSYRKMKNAFLQLKDALAEDFDPQSTLNLSLVALLSQREEMIKNNIYCKHFPGNLRAALFSGQLRRISKILSVSLLPAKFHVCLARIFNGWLCKSARFLKPSLIDLFCLFDVL